MCGTSLASEAPEPRAKRKVVTIVFCDLVGFTARAEQLEPEDVQAVLGPYQRNSVRRSRTNDAERAVRAATSERSKKRPHKLQVHPQGFRVTVVFCDLVGFTSRAESLDPEDVAAILRPYHARVRAELEHYGGTVEKFIGDAVMALFGAPVAHEDDPERAVRAALAIREFAGEDGLELRVGITTGEALVSLDASPAEGEGMASGDVVNTAARLQSAAPVNGVIVDETTYRATRTRRRLPRGGARRGEGQSGADRGLGGKRGSRAARERGARPRRGRSRRPRT